MKTKRIVLILLIVLISRSGTFGQAVLKPAIDSQEKPFNIIMMIGDGMGLSQLSSAYYFGDREPNFSRFPVIGLSKINSSTHKITDSAAGATAFSCGIKTYNNSIAMGLDSTAVKTILEELSEIGWNTGVVSTSSITHATPGSFYAHATDRSMEEEIARQLVYSDVDFVAGGGYKWFINRTDSINYSDSLMAHGFVLDTNSINTPWTGGNKRPIYLLAADGLTPKHKGRDEFLTEATQKAIDHLSAKGKSFFLMVEGSQIDWGGHNNDGEYVIQEVLDFDKSIGAVLDFAAAQGNTLVIVTADHETGGFTMASERKTGAFKRVYDDYDSIVPSFSTGGHSCTMVPVLSYGPKAEQLGSIFENIHIHAVIKKACGLK
jgi:alkaline phosphatase